MRSLQIVMVLAVVPFTIATAQSHRAAWPLDSGSRVRIQAPIFSGQEQQATVLRTDGDTLHFQPWRGTASNAVGVNDITRIDVHQGTHGRKLKGALIGFVLAGGAAAAITAATWKRSANFDFGRQGDAALAGFLGGIAGGVIGLVVGSFETDTWAPVKLPARN